MESDTLISLTTDIVAAHVSNNPIASSDVPSLIQAVYKALAAADQPAAAEPEVLSPAVSVRSSVKPDAITCLECGAKFKMLKRHLTTDHNLTPEEYKARWGLRADYPLVAPDYSETRKQLAVKIGLGRKGTGRKPAAAKPAAAKANGPKTNGRKANGSKAKAPAKQAEPSA